MITYDDDSFDLDIPAKDLAGAEFVIDSQRALVAAVVEQIKAGDITKGKIAMALGVNKSTVSRMLSGNANLTARSIGELCWAMGIKPELRLSDPKGPAGNHGHITGLLFLEPTVPASAKPHFIAWSGT